jgi:diaminopimelate epimerase
VWERGSGLTKACGTAACATAVAAHKLDLADKAIDIKFELGIITITIEQDNSIKMKGKVSEIKKINIAI